ncbi:MAG: sensor histidine kinase [Bacteroidetes bacterium]|nr:MAG: sensor histidine kinase [Bacteroidota bacterium]
MTHLTKFLFCIVVLLTWTSAFSQNKYLDSLERELSVHIQQDTNRVNLLNLVIYEVYSFDIEKAEKLLIQSDSLSKKIAYKKGGTDVVFFRGLINLEKSNYDSSITQFSEALESSENLNYYKGMTFALNGLAIAYSRKGELSKAFAYFKRSADISKRLNDPKKIAGSLNNIGIMYYRTGEYDSAIAYYEMAVEAYQSIPDNRGLSKAYANIANIYKHQSNYPKALEYGNKALSIFEELGLSKNKSALLNHFGNIYHSQGDYEKALIYYQKALKISESQGNKGAMATCLNNIGYVFRDQHKVDTAMVLFHRTLAIHRKSGDKGGAAVSLNNIAKIHLVKNHFSKALEFYSEALDISTEIGSQLSKGTSYLGMAKSCFKLNRKAKALEFTLKSLEISEELNLLSLRKESYQTLSEIYQNSGDHKKALECYQQFKLLNDSLYNKENILEMAQMECEYQYKRERDSARNREQLLDQQVKITSSNLANSQRNTFLIVVVFLLASIVLGAVILFQRLSNEKSKIQKIVVEQRLLRSQMAPHFMFNSLTVLQGMILKKDDKSNFYLCEFSKLLRITLENSRHQTVSLSKELFALNSYIELRNLDLTPPYNYLLAIDDEINIHMFMVPPMLIQPFVENAMENALANNNEDRKIDIKISFRNKELICTIADNGTGIKVDEFKTDKNKTSLSTAITAERLDLLSNDFNMLGSVNIKNKDPKNGSGTLVTLVIPYKIQENV